MKALYWIVGVVVVAGGAWAVMGMPGLDRSGGGNTDTSPDTQDVSNASEATDVQDEPGEFKGSLQDLVARSGSWQCEVSVTTQGVTTKGTTYASGGKVRADFVSSVPGYGDITSHMIMRDATVYTWSSMMSTGMKFPIQDGKMQGDRKSTEVTPQFDQMYDYSCAAWTTDESKFALPSGITF
jgi:hypothetical protein